MATNIEGFTPERGKFLIDNSKWKDRIFKSEAALEKLYSSSLKDWVYNLPKAENGQTRLLYLHVTKLGRKFTEAFTDPNYYFIRSYLGSLGVDPAPQTAWDDCFCEEMFELIVQLPEGWHDSSIEPPVKYSNLLFADDLDNLDDAIEVKYEEWISHPGGDSRSNAGPGYADIDNGFPVGAMAYWKDLDEKENSPDLLLALKKKFNQSDPQKEGFRPDRPTLTETEAELIIRRSKWLTRKFNLHAIVTLDLVRTLPSNLYDWIVQMPGKRLDEILFKMQQDSPITWNGVMSDLSYNDIVTKSYSVHTFDLNFREVMFFPLSNTQQRTNELSEDDDYYATI